MRYRIRFQRANRENRMTRKHRENQLRQGPELHLVECHSFIFAARRRSASCDWPWLPSTPASGIEPAGGQQTDKKQHPDVSHRRFARTGVSQRTGGHTHTHTHTHGRTHTHTHTHAEPQGQTARGSCRGRGRCRGGGTSRWRRRSARAKRSVGTGMCRLKFELGSAKLRRILTTSENLTCCFEARVARHRLPDWSAS